MRLYAIAPQGICHTSRPRHTMAGQTLHQATTVTTATDNAPRVALAITSGSMNDTTRVRRTKICISNRAVIGDPSTTSSSYLSVTCSYPTSLVDLRAPVSYTRAPLTIHTLPLAHLYQGTSLTTVQVAVPYQNRASTCGVLTTCMKGLHRTLIPCVEVGL